MHMSVANHPKPVTIPEANPNTSVNAQMHILDKAAWHATFKAEFAAAQANDEPLTVLFMDVNGFKSVNDELGHDEGDRVIAEMAGVIELVSDSFHTKNNFSNSKHGLDVMYQSEQYDLSPVDVNNKLIDSTPGHAGGDEFAVICKTSNDGAQVIVDRLRAAFAAFLDQPQNHRIRELGVGLAIGAATMDKDTEKSVDLLREADAAMYDDKLLQLPELTNSQKQALRGAAFLLKESGVRLRDVSKYLHLSELE